MEVCLVQMIFLFNPVIFRFKILIFRGVAGVPSITRWWFEIFSVFTPTWGRLDHLDHFTNVSQLGWFNHQPEKKQPTRWSRFWSRKKKRRFDVLGLGSVTGGGLHGCHEWCVEGSGWMSCCRWRCLECPLAPKPWWNPGSCWEMKEAKLGGFGPSFLGEPSHRIHGMIVYLPRWIPIKINHSCRYIYTIHGFYWDVKLWGGG